jgi:uncharacterized protein (TIGR02246 family)
MSQKSVRQLLLIAAIFAAPVHDAVQAQTKSGRDAIAITPVRAVLDAQVEAWNRGDIEGFMDGYARSPDTTFISDNNFTRGWQKVHDRYQKNYDSREKMGTLTFSDLETRLLSSDAAVTIGRWHLQLANSQPHGRFTLIFRRTRQGWRIVHDHTSSAP